jgi:hypothetical protein
MKFSDFERRLKAAHLGGQGATVKIERIETEETHPKPGKTEKALVVYFEGKSRGLILSATNCRTLAELFGDDVQRCVGQTVSIRAVPVRVAGETKHPIRIFAAGPVPAAQPPARRSAA